MDIRQALEQLPFIQPAERAAILRVAAVYPARVSPYYLSQIRQAGDPIYRQCIPAAAELELSTGRADPLDEERDSPAPRLSHRYPDRVLLMVTNNCRVYCRFCTRKRNIRDRSEDISDAELAAVIDYLSNHQEVRDVLISGGDPLTLSTGRLEEIIAAVRSIGHVGIVRIGTRIPCVDPQRIDAELCAMLRRYHPLYLNVHFNHPVEVTPQAARACAMLADAGIPLGNQSVLLRGVNDDPRTMKALTCKLLEMRVKPYYLFLPDLTRGTAHFRTSIDCGLALIDAMRGWQTGLAVPQLVLDAENGCGKIPLLPNYLLARSGLRYTFRNYQGRTIDYWDVPQSGDPPGEAGQNQALLQLLKEITGAPALGTLKEALNWYYRAIPGLLARSFLGPLCNRTIFARQLKESALSDYIFLPALEAVACWPHWDEVLAGMLLTEVFPPLLGITSLRKADNSRESLALALGQLARQTGEGELRLFSPLCPSYQYREDAAGQLWHASGALLPTVGPRFGKVALTLGTVFAPLARHGVRVDWEFWGYSGETQDAAHLVDMGSFVHRHYADQPAELFATLQSAYSEMAGQLDAALHPCGIRFATRSFDREFGEPVRRLCRDFAERFPDQLEGITALPEMESWLQQSSSSTALLDYFIAQERFYRRNVHLPFSEALVLSALREMFLYTHILRHVQNRHRLIVNTESTSNYMVRALRHLPAGILFTRKCKGSDTDSRYTLNIRQPYR